MLPLLSTISVIAVMGWLIVLISFLVGFFVLNPAQATFFSDAKAVREGAASSSTFVQANATIHVTTAWLPQFKFFGLGLGLLSITMALGIIAKQLQLMGQVITGHMPADLRPAMPSPPKVVRVFKLSAMQQLKKSLSGFNGEAR